MHFNQRVSATAQNQDKGCNLPFFCPKHNISSLCGSTKKINTTLLGKKHHYFLLSKPKSVFSFLLSPAAGQPTTLWRWIQKHKARYGTNRFLVLTQLSAHHVLLIQHVWISASRLFPFIATFLFFHQWSLITWAEMRSLGTKPQKVNISL